MPASTATPSLPASTRMGGLVNMPTALNSAQLARLDATTRRLSFFSAAVEDAHLLQGLREMVQAGIDEGLPEASAVARMRQWIRETRSAVTGQTYLGDRSGWTVEERVAYENSVKHIDSLARLKLIFRTQAEMGAGYHQWQQGYTRLSLAAYPAWRFYRRPGAKTFRADHEEHEGQVRLKTDLPYWLARNRVEIGGFANPWPPFGYNSWMWIAPVSRRECEKLGLLKKGEGIVPLTDEQADTWGVPRLLQTTLGDRSGRTMDDTARQHVIDTCAKHGFSIRYNEQTGKFEFAPDEVSGANPYGCNGQGHQPRCPRARGNLKHPERSKTSESKGLGIFRIRRDLPKEEQAALFVKMAQKSMQRKRPLYRVMKKTGLGWIDLHPGNISSNTKGGKGKQPKGGYGLLHALEERHDITLKDIAETLTKGEVIKGDDTSKRFVIWGDVKLKFQVGKRSSKLIDGFRDR